jgi:small subunit ribosomal protein S30e
MPSMQLFIKSSAGSERFECDAADTVEDLKAQLCARTGLKGPELAYNGRVLEDVCTLGDYDVDNEATLEAYVPMLGGKQHGSLARAGKVRGQTPKVEKQDKKKKKTGRAKRRIQYNRRFVNAVGGQFAKKGPNNLAMQQMRAGIVPTK